MTTYRACLQFRAGGPSVTGNWAEEPKGIRRNGRPLATAA